jgi:hypothetical protein
VQRAAQLAGDALAVALGAICQGVGIEFDDGVQARAGLVEAAMRAR